LVGTASYPFPADRRTVAGGGPRRERSEPDEYRFELGEVLAVQGFKERELFAVGLDGIGDAKQPQAPAPSGLILVMHTILYAIR
jgi:hypothetical protein